MFPRAVVTNADKSGGLKTALEGRWEMAQLVKELSCKR